MVSEYNKFVSQHIRSAPGANIKDKMRAVAAMWRKRKGRGAGLMAPSGRGLRAPGGGVCTMHCRGRHKKGCGFWEDLWSGVKGAAKIAGPRLIDLALKKIGAGYKRGGSSKTASEADLIKFLKEANSGNLPSSGDYGFMGKKGCKVPWRGAMPQWPAREGASGGRVRKGKGGFAWGPDQAIPEKRLMERVARRGAASKQGALAAMIHGLGMRA
jgi:hypothetical protein